ncbi:HpcH/HpaI aldolase family protein [Halotalea alkalilenta]|uniref:HpcH/HpaI aldolase family protein n=1 Tax=Halotalea alkalilenta TaxID=376489 RepID=UPI00047FA062|nr:HpcH/HpaI aldolase/citrate lyase family protein [Halotalea alkalilenta]
MRLPINAFKTALAQGEPMLGCWAGMAQAYPCEIMATAGFEWLLLDGEHAPNTVPSMLAQLQALAAYPDCAPVVRTVNHDPALIKQLLDIGAQTLMVPMVDTFEQAQALVRAMRYPPRGIRGVGGGLARATRWDGVEDYFAQAERELCLIVQIESATGVDNVEAIAAADGVDAVFVGPADLSVSLGHPLEPNHPQVQRKIRQAIQAIHAAGKPSGILAPREEDAKRYLEWGCTFVAIGIDISLLRQAALAALAPFKGGAPAAAPSSTY